MEHTKNAENNIYVHNQVIIGICVVLIYVCRRVPSLGRHRFLPEKQLSLIFFSFFLMKYEQMRVLKKKNLLLQFTSHVKKVVMHAS